MIDMTQKVRFKILENFGFGPNVMKKSKVCVRCGQLVKTRSAVCPECGEKLIVAGPMWLGPIQNEEFIDSMIEIAEEKNLNQKDNVLKLLNSCKIEANAPSTFYDIHKVCRALKISAPKFDKVFDKLEEEGFIAVKTHYSPLGIKTNASNKELMDIITELAK